MQPIFGLGELLLRGASAYFSLLGRLGVHNGDTDLSWVRSLPQMFRPPLIINPHSACMLAACLHVWPDMLKSLKQIEEPHWEGPCDLETMGRKRVRDNSIRVAGLHDATQATVKESSLVKALLRNYYSGEVSATAIQEICQCAAEDGITHADVHKLARLGSNGLQIGHVARDLETSLQPIRLHDAMVRLPLATKLGKRVLERMYMTVFPINYLPQCMSWIQTFFCMYGVAKTGWRWESFGHRYPWICGLQQMSSALHCLCGFSETASPFLVWLGAGEDQFWLFCCTHFWQKLPQEPAKSCYLCCGSQDWLMVVIKNSGRRLLGPWSV